MLYQTRDHSPSAINHVEHDLPTLSDLKYMPRQQLQYRSRGTLPGRLAASDSREEFTYPREQIIRSTSEHTLLLPIDDTRSGFFAKPNHVSGTVLCVDKRFLLTQRAI